MLKKRMLKYLSPPLMLMLCTGCLFLPGRNKLDLVKKSRPSFPWAETVFKKNPGPEERDLAELRRTLSFWTAKDPAGSPRWKSVLQPSSPDLYQRVLQAAQNDSGNDKVVLVAYRYDAIGLDTLTLVDYFDGNNRHLGWDYVPYTAMPEGKGKRITTGYDDIPWWGYPQLVLDVPIYLAIGLKEFCGEIIKSPLSAIDAGWLGTATAGRSPFSPVCLAWAGKGFAEDWRNGLTALSWRFRVYHRHTPLDLGQDLLGAIPIFGPMFEQNRTIPSLSSLPPQTVIAYSQGIHAGDADQQVAAGLEKGLTAIRPHAQPLGLPFYYGGVFDVVWSILNISNGMAYDAADQIVFHHEIDPKKRIELVGYSGGAQRLAAASIILKKAGYKVDKVIGIAGPMAGFCCAGQAWSLLTAGCFSDSVVLAARTVNLLYLLLPGNIDTVKVPQGGPHHTPCFPDGATRAPVKGYYDNLKRCLLQ